ncbi:hypothetical protein C8A03DRAFT_31805 [Achaetomium macrosporum]|uniref:Uncharacterized protein n=1 Tax=Achaetomium macrosporum TaxID=79813 RepID=A0AAN7CDJ9_9PEZI|nr:hypothetical protein C8A03DRAFT_31805 [Achaetomium macrosporum]
MSRFNFFARGRDDPDVERGIGQSHPNEPIDPYDDRAPLSPRTDILPDDIEAQHPAAATVDREMAERHTPQTRFLHRFRPPIPSFFSTASSRRYPRPSSSHYSGDGLRGAPDTVIGGGVESPKSPDFRIGEPELPSTRLHLPNLARTWTQGSNGPPTRPGTQGAGIAAPEPVVHARRRYGGSDSSSGSRSSEEAEHRERRRRRREPRGHRRDGSGSGSGRSRSGRSGRSHRSGSRRSQRSRDEGSRSERRARRERRRGTDGSRGSRSTRSERRPPKHFLFCFPWVKSRRIRSQILRSFVSGLFLALSLSVYLALTLTKNNKISKEFTILLVVIILAVTVFFCHSLIRLCMLVVKARKREQATQQGRLPEMIGPGGYAIPREPIPVVLARDEEVAGIESEATKTGPPPYGMWRESVRVDPNRMFWVRNQNAPVEEESEVSSSSGPGSTHSGSGRTNIPRPPSYSSDDGVSYVVDARPRSIAPRGNGPHAGSSQPSESGRSEASWI